jgi:DNA polymerase-3 subunit alpha
VFGAYVAYYGGEVTDSNFVHLHVHTDYSLLDGAAQIGDLVAAAYDMEQPALAITDHGNMYGAVEFYDACVAQGIKPIIGYEAYLARRTMKDKEAEDRSSYHLTLLAMNETGYRNLIKLSSKASLDGFYYKPRVDKELLSEYHDGIICLSGCMMGEASQALLHGDPNGVVAALQWGKQIFGDRFYCELQMHGLDGQQELCEALQKLADALAIQCVATNDVHYLDRQGYETQELLLCTQTHTTLDDPKRMRFGSSELYLKSGEEMGKLFQPEYLANTVEVAERCNLQIEKQLLFPEYQTPDGSEAEVYLRKVAFDGFVVKYPNYTPELLSRLNYELDVICKKGFAPYFLVVLDFITFARSRGILAQARGSAAGSIVAYSLGISLVEPITNDLMFERFLRVDGKKMPDIDVDFCDNRRGEILQYVSDKYGADHVAQIITFGRMGAKAAVKDSARAMGCDFATANWLSSKMPDVGSIEKAFQDDPTLWNSLNQHAKEVVTKAFTIEGLCRSAGTHAAGVVISRVPVTDVCPLQASKGSTLPTTQFDWRTVERIGLVKMDFLGVTYLTVAAKAQEIIRDLHGVELKLEDIPLDDQDVYKMLAMGETDGVFQVESDGMRKMLAQLKPTCFADLVPLLALYRPGPLQSGMAQDFMKRRHGKAQITYLHPILEPILKSTYGILLYQEQVMRIAMDMAGFDSIEAEGLMKGMGKKKPEIMAQYRDKFVDGAVINDVDEKVASQIYELMAKFAGYGFNKSHAAAYALLMYHTAWVKLHYPAEYMTAILTCHSDDKVKVAHYVSVAKRMGIPVLKPDVNESEAGFSCRIDGQPSILAGLSCIERLSEASMAEIERIRQDGPVTSLLDFCKRVQNARAVNSAVIKNMIEYGAFDRFAVRSQMLEKFDLVLREAKRYKTAIAKGKTCECDEAKFGFTAPVQRQEKPKSTPAGEQIILRAPRCGKQMLLSLAVMAKRYEGDCVLVIKHDGEDILLPGVRNDAKFLKRIEALTDGAVVQN